MSELAPSYAELKMSEDECAKLRADNMRLKQALEFYARPLAYQGDNIKNEGQDPYTPADNPYVQSVGRDGGRFARKALGLNG